MMTTPAPALPTTSWRKRKSEPRDEEAPRQEFDHRRGKTEAKRLRRLKVKERKRLEQDMLELACELFLQQKEKKEIQTTRFHKLENGKGFFFDEEERVAYLYLGEQGLKDVLAVYHQQYPICTLVEGGCRYETSRILRKQGLQRKLRMLNSVEELVSCLKEQDVRFPLVKYNSAFGNSHLALQNIRLTPEEDIVEEASRWLD
jgi:hypothetical protein